MNGYLPMALILTTFESSLAPSCTLTTIVAMITLASSVLNEIDTSFFCLGANTPIIEMGERPFHKHFNWRKERLCHCRDFPNLFKLTLGYVDDEKTSIFGLD